MQINILGVVQNQTSYGSTTINLVTALANLGHEVALFPIGDRVELDKECGWTHRPVMEALERSKYDYSIKAPSIRLYHQFSQSEFVGNGPRIAFPIFELDRLTKLEIAQLSRVDHIISCSKWADSIIRSEIIDREYEKAVHSNLRGGRDIGTSLVPLGVDGGVFNTVYGYADQQSELNRKTTTFIHIGKTEVRKSSREIVDCFKKAFNDKDDVKLLLAWFNIFNTKEEQEEWGRFAKSGTIGHKIEILPRFGSCTQIARLIKSSDCVVSMSKAEGWNYGNLEGFACGKSVITTINSGQSEFCDNMNSLVVETNNKVRAFDGKWFTGKDFPGESGQWAEIGTEQKEKLIQHLRDVHQSKQGGILQVNQAGIETSKLFSWENSANHLIQALENIL